MKIEWQDAVRACLQLKLVEFGEAQTAYPTCKVLSDAGFGSHQECYLKPNPAKPEVTWCKLPVSDQAKIAWIARGQFWEILSQGIPILMKCFTGGAIETLFTLF